MITTFKITIEHLIIAVLVILLLLKSCGSNDDCNRTATVTTVEETVTTKRDSTSIPGINNRKPETVNVIETPTSIRRVKDIKDLPEEDRALVKPAHRYQDTTRLDGAVIFSDLLIEGRILDFNWIAEIDHTVITLTHTETAVKNAGGVIISPGINYSSVIGVIGLDTSITYIKVSFVASAGGYYNL